MKRSSQLVAFALCAMLTTPVLADRYAVSLNGGPTIYVGDAQETLASYEPATGMTPPTPRTLAALPAPPAPPNTPPVNVPADAGTLAARVVTGAPFASGGTESDLSDVTSPVQLPPDPQFLAALNRVYAVTDQAEIEEVWDWYQKEPGSLALDQRVGNAVVRFIMAVNKAPSGDNNAQPEKLKPEATRAVVRSSNGVGVRASPWGPSGGAAIGFGTALEVIPPAEGPWYRVRTGGGEGWVCGVWLDLQ